MNNMNKYLAKAYQLSFRIVLVGLFLFFGSLHLAKAQEVINDTTIYQVVDDMPLFPGCVDLEGDKTLKKTCSDKNVLGFIYQNIQYPILASDNGHEGQVVVKFVVEKNGKISNGEIIRNVEGGCGEEALRVIDMMNLLDKSWKPGIHKGDTVRTQIVLPIKFKLEEAPDFTFIDGDSVYTNFDTQAEFNGGLEALAKYIETNLKYPDAFQDTCLVGAIDLEALVNPDEVIKVKNMVDYQNLGLDFQMEAINLMVESMGSWKSATLEGRDVPTTFPVRLVFKSENATCQQLNKDFDKAELLMVEGIGLVNEEKKDEGLTKMNEAIQLIPANADYLYTRGMVYFNDNEMKEACDDLTQAKAILGSSWFDNLIPIICAGSDEGE